MVTCNSDMLSIDLIIITCHKPPFNNHTVDAGTSVPPSLAN